MHSTGMCVLVKQPGCSHIRPDWVIDTALVQSQLRWLPCLAAVCNLSFPKLLARRKGNIKAAVAGLHLDVQVHYAIAVQIE